MLLGRLLLCQVLYNAKILSADYADLSDSTQTRLESTIWSWEAYAAVVKDREELTGEPHPSESSCS